MLDLDQIRKPWSLLQTLHQLFLLAKSLPTVEGVEKGQYDEVPMDKIDSLRNEITLLRIDLEFNIMEQKEVDIDQLTQDESLLQELQTALQTLLGEFENMIDVQVEERPETEFTDSMLSNFPRLVALRRFLLSQSAAELSNVFVNDEDDTPLHDTSDGSVSTGTQSPWSIWPYTLSTKRAASYIHFPREPKRIESCRRIITRFKLALISLRRSTPSWSTAVQALDCTPRDVAVIQDTYKFALACTSLFEQIVDKTTCRSPHHAELHLSGFSRDQITMNLGTCQDVQWQSVQFVTSLEKSAGEVIPFDRICSPVPPSQQAPKDGMLRIAFDTHRMWICSVDHCTAREPNTHFRYDQYAPLDTLINPQTHLTPKYRKLMGALLAGSFFRLGDSPWIEEQLEWDKIIVPPRDENRIRQWFPRINCTMAKRTAAKPRGEQIAALGVLILELEANRKAEWTTMDCDLETGNRSNAVRLARILEDWEDLVTDNYRDVARACLEFDSHVRNLGHQGIIADIPSLKDLAITFKFIFEPLWRHTVTSFGALDFVFQGLFDSQGCVGLSNGISPATNEKLILFDDEVSDNAEQRASGYRFIERLKPFCERIGELRFHQENIKLTNRREKFRIAVLDSGADDGDIMVRSAINQGRINKLESRDFVDQLPEGWRDDTHGHGTQITRLLLQTALAAEVYVGKICTGKLIDDKLMPRIAEAIRWAVQQCNVDIISISFGFDRENEEIDKALAEAVGKGKLIFAAASNNGGLSGRARPARSAGVICIHASDGMGNKGSMNPTRVLKKDNFSTLGVGVPFRWECKLDSEQVWKSGTSFAAPIAAGLAANVLEFANYKCSNLTPTKRSLLSRKEGMQEIFRAMAKERDDYDFIHPIHLWKDWGESGNGKAEQDAIKKIEEKMQEI